MKLVVDMNLAPDWARLLREHGFEAVHWSEIGDARAPDSEIMRWARDNQAVVFTHDLDFGILLAHTQAGRPSVIQVRVQNVAPASLGSTVVAAIKTHREALEAGALVTVDAGRARVRVLPIGSIKKSE